MNSHLIWGSLLVLSLTACSSFQRRNQAPAPAAAPAPTEDSTTVLKATPIPPVTPADPNVKMVGTPVAKKGTASTAAQPDIKLIDKNGKVITAPANAAAKGGKEMTKVEVPNEQVGLMPMNTADSDSMPTEDQPSESRGFVASTRKAGPISAEKALGWLKNGNTRFVKNRFRRDGATPADRRRVAAHSAPHAIVLADSDARVPPEVIFDQKLGEIYVVRVAGLSLSENVIGSIEYAMEYLGSNLIVVLGQESSPAIKAALGTLGGGGLGSPNLNGMIAGIRPHLQDFKGKAPSENLIAEAWANNDGVAHELADRSQIIREGLTSGVVKIEQGLYHLNSGIVDWK